jgi:hypothetical protein
MVLKFSQMNKIFIILLVITFSACQTKKEKMESTIDSTAIQKTEPVQRMQLTEAQKAEGWKILFDGQSLNGWRMFKNEPNNSWEVIDGTLHCKPFDEEKENLRSDLITNDQYDNFELSLEWKISAQGNSGVIYRVTEAFDQPYKSGPEYQILDDGGYPGESKPTNMTACSYDMYSLPHKKLNPVSEWNTTKIVANGKTIEHWLNGEKVLTYEIGSTDWMKRKEGSKWRDEAGYGMTAKGHIDLQDHQHEVWFRNIIIKPL